MIKFFRTIRQNLLADDKTAKYLKYAIGEITLVVIGILIALQINTWKNNRQLRLLEIETLTEIQSALNQDLSTLSVHLKSLESKVIHGREVILHLENKLPYDKKLDDLFMNLYFHQGYKNLNESAFELLRERGFDIIQNVELRKQITKHYTTNLLGLKDILSRLEQVNLMRADKIFDNFKVRKLPEDQKVKMIAYDYEQVINDPKIIGSFNHLEVLTYGYVDVLTIFKGLTEQLLMKVDTELEDRKK